ncbi:MAG: riboflavin kinase [Candidatus Nanohaloarchaea archaeon]|jgi:riboflavin kinase
MYPSSCDVKGEIFTGEGKASEFLQIEEYQNFIEEEAGFEPFPGTLNLRADVETVEKFKQKARIHKMDGFTREGKEFGGLKIFLGEIKGLKCCIVEPELTRYGEDVVEVCAPVKIRSRFDLGDGDSVKVEPIS